jgi:hypothetical protein
MAPGISAGEGGVSSTCRQGSQLEPELRPDLGVAEEGGRPGPEQLLGRVQESGRLVDQAGHGGCSATVENKPNHSPCFLASSLASCPHGKAAPGPRPSCRASRRARLSVAEGSWFLAWPSSGSGKEAPASAGSVCVCGCQ